MKKFVLRDFERPAKDIIEEFDKSDVSTVYEAQGKIGLMNDSIKSINPGDAIVGPAVTVTCQSGDNLMIHAAIEICKPGDILIVSVLGEVKSGMIGELIVKALIRKGVKGVIIDGGIRDVKELREMHFPIWSKYITSRGNTKNQAGWVNREAVCGNVLVRPGDLIIADDDGIVVVAKEDFEDTLRLTRAREEKERKVMERIANGEISMDFYELRKILDEQDVFYATDEKELYKFF